MEKLWGKIKESIMSVAPIAVIVAVLQFTVVPMPLGTIMLFWAGAVVLIFGMGLFSLGADVAMMPMGEMIGSNLTKTNKLWILLPICFLLGTMITAAEPDLQVLAEQVPSVPNLVLIVSVATGVGLFLALAFLRILYQIPLNILFIVFYTLIFLMTAFTSESYLAVAFDSGGVTTGPITVPFILALGVGLSSVLGGKSSHDDSFGLVALCSIGPIIAVMIMGLFFDSASISHGSGADMDISGFSELVSIFAHGFYEFANHVAIALSPIIIFFVIFQFTVLKLSKPQLIKITVGLIYTFVGLVLFLAGANVAFIPVGKFIGETVGSFPSNWVLIPLGALMGFFVVAAEPAVHILTNQVWDMTAGAISKKALMGSLSIGVAISIAIAMARILFHISIWYAILPGYALALILTFFSPKVFTAIAFDSGGVASGPMTATFVLAFSMGACDAVGGNLLTDAFGIVAMVAMTPLITIQILGVIYKLKLRYTEEEEDEALDLNAEEMEEYIELESEGPEAEAHAQKQNLAGIDTTLEELLEKDNYYINLEFED
ncbi:MAG: DUF1538 domain-containing protein [Anaerovoracaceae bacterium]